VGDEGIVGEFAGVRATGYGDCCTEIDSGVIGEMGDTKALAASGGYVADVQAAVVGLS
jgi:hypothetical protein